MKIIKIFNDLQEIELISVGATIHKWIAYKDRTNIVISNKNLNDYQNPKNGYFNTTIGRVANRILEGKFTLNGISYELDLNFDNKNHGHGGKNGLYTKDFEVYIHTQTKAVFKISLKDMEDGYPGDLELYVTYELFEEEMKITYEATSSKDTILNLTNHAHFNLSNEADIQNHEVKVNVDKMLETDELLVPTGKYIDIKNSVFDLNEMTKLKDILNKEEVQKKTLGLDHPFITKSYPRVHLKYNNKNLVVTSNYPSLQIYTMNHPLNQQLLDRNYKKHMGIAFEMQYEPNAINIPHFSQTVLKQGQKYHKEIIFKVFEG